MCLTGLTCHLGSSYSRSLLELLRMVNSQAVLLARLQHLPLSNLLLQEVQSFARLLFRRLWEVKSYLRGKHLAATP
jgi:hypothetical protein